MIETEFTELDDAEIERLALLMEECAEVQQIIGKILRHGYYTFNPFDKNKTTNKSLLNKEIGHLYLTIQLMFDNDDIDLKKVEDSTIAKKKEINKYLHFNKVV